MLLKIFLNGNSIVRVQMFLLGNICKIGISGSQELRGCLAVGGNAKLISNMTEALLIYILNCFLVPWVYANINTSSDKYPTSDYSLSINRWTVGWALP